MKANIINEEKLFSKGITVILTIVTVILLFVLLYQILIGPIGTRPAPDWVLLLVFVLFFGITINFSILSIRMTSQLLTVGYGIFKHKILWADVEDCYLDEISQFSYGGWGIRIGRVKGKWRLVYNVIGGDRVVLLLNKGRFREFVFSTKKPEDVINLIKQKNGGIR